MNLLKLMHKTGVDRMQVSLINGEPHPAIVALADELEAHWKKTVTERDEYAQELRDQVEKLAEECVVLRASSRSKLETISSLELQVEKLTNERDDLHRAFNQPVPRSEWEKMQEQLAALAEQNEKMREALANLEEAARCVQAGEWDKQSINPERMAAKKALSLPNLATSALNRIKAEAYREAAEIAGPEDSYQDQWFKAKSDSCAKLRAKADELEQSK